MTLTRRSILQWAIGVAAGTVLWLGKAVKGNNACFKCGAREITDNGLLCDECRDECRKAYNCGWLRCVEVDRNRGIVRFESVNC